MKQKWNDRFVVHSLMLDWACWLFTCKVLDCFLLDPVGFEYAQPMVGKRLLIRMSRPFKSKWLLTFHLVSSEPTHNQQFSSSESLLHHINVHELSLMREWLCGSRKLYIKQMHLCARKWSTVAINKKRFPLKGIHPQLEVLEHLKHQSHNHKLLASKRVCGWNIFLHTYVIFKSYVWQI